MDARTRLRRTARGRPAAGRRRDGHAAVRARHPAASVLDELVATRPELIGAIHREYIEAGADIIETATFGANRPRLAPFGLADQAGRLNRRAAQLAREARDVAGRDVLVAGSIGPLGPPTRELLPPRRGGDPRRASASRSRACSKAASTSCVRDVLASSTSS